MVEIMNTLTLKRLYKTNPEKITQPLCNESMRQNPHSIQWVPNQFKTYDVYQIAKQHIERSNDYFAEKITEAMIENKLFRPDGSWNTATRGHPEEDRITELRHVNKFLHFHHYQVLKKNLKENILLDKWEYDPYNLIDLPVSLQKERLAETFDKLNDKNNPILNNKLANLFNILFAQTSFKNENDEKLNINEIKMFLDRFVQFRGYSELGELEPELLSKKNLISTIVNDVLYNNVYDALDNKKITSSFDNATYDAIYQRLFSLNVDIQELLKRTGPLDHNQLIDYAQAYREDLNDAEKTKVLNTLWDTNDKENFYKEIIKLNSNLYFAIPKEYQNKLTDFTISENKKTNSFYLKEFLETYPYLYKNLPDQYKSEDREAYANIHIHKPNVPFADCWEQSDKKIEELLSKLKPEDLSISQPKKEKVVTHEY